MGERRRRPHRGPHGRGPAGAGTLRRCGGGASRPNGLPAVVEHVRLTGSWRARLAVIRQVLLADEVHIGGGGLLSDRVPDFYRPFYRVARAA